MLILQCIASVVTQCTHISQYSFVFGVYECQCTFSNVCFDWSAAGIVQRSPPSPAPSSGTTSIMSAPSAFGLSSRDGSAAHLLTSRDLPLSSAAAVTSQRHGAGECCIHGGGGGADSAQANADFIGSLNKLTDVSYM